MTKSSKDPSNDMNTNKMKQLLQIGPLPPGLQSLLAQRYLLHPLWQEPQRATFLVDNADRFDGAVTMSRHGCSADVFSILGNGVVACFGVGFEGIDLGAARQYNVQVSTTPDVLTNCVADCAFGLILATARQLVAADRFVQAGTWRETGFGLSSQVSGKRLGIVGLGRIGQAIARRATGFDMQLRYYGRRKQDNASLIFEPDLHALAEWADFLIVACRGGEQTRHLISSSVLQALGPTGFLINIARGSIVDEDALVKAVNQGGIGGAGLDVYAQEPDVPQGLLNNDRVVLLPHIAAATRETRAAMEQLVADNLQSFFASGHILTPPG